MVTMSLRFLLLVLSLVLMQSVFAKDDLDLRVADLEEIGNDLVDKKPQETLIGVIEEENSALRAELDEVKLLLSSLSGVVQALDSSTIMRFATLEGDITTLGADVRGLESDVTDLGESTDQRLVALEENFMNYSHTAFLASHSAFEFVPTDPIVWDTAILNPGGHYNPESGIYTVPVDGIYQFVLQYKTYNDQVAGAFLVVDDVWVAFTSEYDTDYGTNSHSLVMTLSLTSGQGVWIRPYFMTGLHGTNDGYIFSWFSGHLIYPL